MIKKLRVRFTCIVMAIVTVMLFVIFGLMIHFTARSMGEQTMGMMTAMMPKGPEMMPENGPPPRPEDKPQIRMPYFQVDLDREGNILTTGGYGELVEEGLLPQLLETILESEKGSGILWEHKLRFHRQESPGGMRVIVADISANVATLGDLVRNCAVIGAAAWLVFLLVSIWLARWAVAPVEAAWQQQKQFVADASHELKTPLTVIMTNAELLQSQGQPAENILTMSRQMRRLVEGMLELARVDNGSVQTAFQELDLSALAADTQLPFEPLFFEKELTLESELAEGIRIKGSEAHIKQVLDILLDNAMKYSAPGGAVRVKLAKQGSHALVSVASPGEAISREDLSNIFKRFYRVDRARSRDGSYGLGLSIARRIVDEHKGKIWAESREGINTFFVQLPLA